MLMVKERRLLINFMHFDDFDLLSLKLFEKHDFRFHFQNHNHQAHFNIQCRKMGFVETYSLLNVYDNISDEPQYLHTFHKTQLVH